MSRREAEGGGQMGEAHWEVFLCVFNKPATLQRPGSLWHSTGFLSLVCAHGIHLVSDGCGHQAGHRAAQLHRVLCAISGSWGYVGIITDLLFSFQLLLYMHVSNKQSWLREYRNICKGLSHLAAMSDLHQLAPEEHSYGVSRDDLVGLHWCTYLSFNLSVLIPFVVVDEETQSFIPFFFVLSVFTRIHDIFIFVSEILYV